MTVHVQAMNFGSSDALFDHARRRMSTCLDRFGRRIKRVSVILRDENGPKGGPDMRCQVRVELDAEGSVIVEQSDADVYSAIDRAADRVKRTVRRRIGKRRDKR